MRTFQELTAVGENEAARMTFALEAVGEHKASGNYRIASDAEEYYARRNVTMSKYQKVIYNVLGNAVNDPYGANYKLTHGFFRRFVLQQTQFVLSNGVTFQKEDTKKKLGNNIDHRLSELAKKAMIDGVSFGFWNLDHLEVFGFADTERNPGFAPLYDEETGALMAGIRYWQPTEEVTRMTLYEADGYTEYIKKKDEDTKVMTEKRAYITSTVSTQAAGVESVTGRNYSRLPIIPMYANDLGASEIVGIRPAIDCYDFIKSGMANNVDETSAFYWTLNNTGGMDDMDLQKFVERMHILKAVSLDDGVEAKAHTIDVPVEANEKLLDRLRKDMYEDFMLMDTEQALSGNMTATAIRLAYQSQEDKCGDFEYYIRDFLSSLMDLVGVEDEPSFTWNRIANQTEETNMVMTCANLLGETLTLKKLPFLTPEEVQERLDEIEREAITRFEEPEEEEPEEEPENG